MGGYFASLLAGATVVHRHQPGEALKNNQAIFAEATKAHDIAFFLNVEKMFLEVYTSFTESYAVGNF